MAAVDAPELAMTKGEQNGHCYLAGMGMGVWWGLAVAVYAFLLFMLVTSASQLGRMMPLILTVCAMGLALGPVLYAIIGLIGANTEDAETTCGNFGITLGILCAPVCFLAAPHPYVGFPAALGSVWVSRALGRALGCKINEWQSTTFVVAGPAGVAMTQYRKR